MPVPACLCEKSSTNVVLDECGSGARASVGRRKGVCGSGARASVDRVPAQGRLWTGRMSASPPGRMSASPPGRKSASPPKAHVGVAPGRMSPGGGGGGRYRAKCMSTGHGGAGGGCSQVWARSPSPPRPAQVRASPAAGERTARHVRRGVALSPPRAAAPNKVRGGYSPQLVC